MYYALLALTHSGRDLLQNDTDVWPQRLSKPSDSIVTRIVLVFGLVGAVLTCGHLVGRRYIDPGSGSFAIQIIIAAVLGGLLTARLWLRHAFWRVVGIVRGKKREEQPAGEEADR